MIDWRSYGTIAEVYPRLWAPPGEAVARHRRAQVAPLEGARLRDRGTGTGAVALALGDQLTRLRAMWVATSPAECCISERKPGGDPYAAPRSEILDGAIGDGTIRRTIEQVVPSEGTFSSPENVRAALVEPGFSSARVEVIDISHDYSVEECLADRDLSSGGWHGRHVRGDTGWRGFLERAKGEFQRSFSDRPRLDRPLALGVGTRGGARRWTARSAIRPSGIGPAEGARDTGPTSLCLPGNSPLPGAASALALVIVAGIATPARAQDNYEIQVYPYETVDRGHTMVELHSNFTFQGSKTADHGVLPTNHQLHETIEITRGLTDWFEVGFYVFTSAKSGQGVNWVGDHIRPRLRIPPRWNWPLGLSLSNEIGYQRREYSLDTWTWEIRPIIDKRLGRWYISFNPTLARSLRGVGVSQGFVFSPNLKISYDITPRITGGIEYYGALGPVTGFDPIHLQQHQIFPTVDLNLSPRWEVNLGVGVGVTRSTDHLLAKMILGYRFDF